MKLVLIGIQGAGKSTQGNLLSSQLGIPYLSTGHIFREIAKEKSDTGRYIKETINAGSLIPDDKTLQIVTNYLNKPEYKKGFIIDGFPRTIAQAEHFNSQVDKVVYINLPDQDALWRIAHRDESGRADETLPAIKKRIDLFHTHTAPVVKYFEKEGKLIEVDGTQTVEGVNEAVLNGLGKEIVHNHVQEWKQKQDIVIGMVSLPGAGKSEAVNYFKSRGIPTVYFGQVPEEVKKRGLPSTEESEKAIRTELRQKFGMEALVKLNEEAIESALTEKKIVVLENMRSFQEYTYLKERFTNTKVVIVAIFASKATRYSRVKQRAERSQVSGEGRDISELIEANVGPTFGFADYMVINEGTKQDLYTQLESIYREIYFS